MYGLRNRIVHGHAYVDYQIIWDTLVNDIPSLINVLEGLLKYS